MSPSAPPAIVNFVPTGMLPTHEQSPHVPISVREVVEDVHRAWEIGITIVHLHAREPKTGLPTSDPEIYAELVTKIRRYAPELVVCVSTSGRLNPEASVRRLVLELEGAAKPDMASLTLGSLNFNHTASINTPQTIRELAEVMRDRAIRPELEIFDSGMANYAKYLIEKSVIRAPYYANLILGNVACAQATPLSLGWLVQELPPETLWSAGGVGRSQLTANLLALAAGGGVRVGLEDNLWYDNGRTRLATNEDLLRRVHRQREELERPLMTSAEFRRLQELT